MNRYNVIRARCEAAMRLPDEKIRTDIGYIRWLLDGIKYLLDRSARLTAKVEALEAECTRLESDVATLEFEIIKEGGAVYTRKPREV